MITVKRTHCGILSRIVESMPDGAREMNVADSPNESPNHDMMAEKWLSVWDELHSFEADGLVGGDDTRPRSYVVSMFPYPSGDLHMGHAEVYSISDAIARYLRMSGFNVLNPIGWDSLGLPAENAAFKRSLDPRGWTYSNIVVQAESFRRLGISFDWRTRLHTSDPSYYRWNQWLFIRMFEAGLAFRKEAAVNWCPNDLTVLANEQVIGGRCERCGADVVQRALTQWFFRTSAYAQRMLDDMALLEGSWPAEILAMQRNWIGRSVGAHIDFAVGSRTEPVRVFTTRPDTLFGATFFVVAVDSALAEELCSPEQRDEFERYRAQTATATEIERLATDRPKTGVFLGRHAVNPINGERIPVYAADYVLAEYGTGAIMAVPAHDQRDLDFARALGLPVRVVIETGAADPAETGVAAEGPGLLVNSGRFDGSTVADGAAAVIAALEEAGAGTSAVTYRLRDWLLSRQRYWGTPIPIIHCPDCGLVPVPDQDLPLELPTEGYQLRPDGGRSPLQSAEDWVRVPCPQCGGPAARDTDTMDTFVDSSWYFLRYPNPDYTDGPFDPAGVARWLPVAEYIGGKEHATGHLMYARFMTKALYDLGLVPFVEPFAKLISQGQVIMNGKAMSKTLGNLVVLQEQIAQHGPDAVRVTMLFAGPPEDDIDWADVSLTGSVKWLRRVLRLADDVATVPAGGPGDQELRRAAHRLVAAATDAMDHRRLNVAIARLMELTNLLRKAIDTTPGPADPVVRQSAEALVRMLSCFAPFTAEEGWQRLGHEPSVATTSWPQADPDLLTQQTTTCVFQVDGKVRDTAEVSTAISEDELRELALASPHVRRAIGEAPITKVIVRAPRITNVVTRG
ncbi:leucine--tRNA ligase [Micromonospora sp. NBC_01655]|uniref:leucine--tRNA ligase n=1 Tax=Micromonospora sp. NBC_01655 TaxID=2975983 RepID=UPI002257A968|nr:leucine--tRNA ligase [Micromonospora sp. NBC_01655]MCX4471597.1 leucine--tRNA ligase [Micromonospora sp. NBC_01655]